MAEYKNVTELPIMDEVTENTHVIVEDGGDFKRVSGNKLGGENANTVIIRSPLYLQYLEYAEQPAPVEAVTDYEAIGMTFETAYALCRSGGVISAFIQSTCYDFAMTAPATVIFGGTMFDGETETLIITASAPNGERFDFEWTADGVTRQIEES